MATSEVQIANEALAKLGAGEIATFDDQTALARAVKRTYWRVVHGMLTDNQWTFTRACLALTPLVEPLQADLYIATGWQYAYALPAYGPGGILAPPYGYLTTPARADELLRDFAVQAGVLYCNAMPADGQGQGGVWALVQQDVSPAFWPAYFRRAAVDSLAYELVMPVSGNSGLRDSLKLEAVGPPEDWGRGGSLYRAMLADGLNESESLGSASPLVDARWT